MVVGKRSNLKRCPVFWKSSVRRVSCFDVPLQSRDDHLDGVDFRLDLGQPLGHRTIPGFHRLDPFFEEDDGSGHPVDVLPQRRDDVAVDVDLPVEVHASSLEGRHGARNLLQLVFKFPDFREKICSSKKAG